MSHPNQLSFVRECASLLKTVYKDASIAEIGAYAVNGSVRDLFDWAGEYVGIDLIKGPGVDVIALGHEFGKSNSYEIVIACEVFEHNPLWLETFLNMVRITKSGGTLIFSCATTGRFEHGTERTDLESSPGTSARGWRYYRNLTKRDFTKHIDLSAHFSSFCFFNVITSKDLYFIGTKKMYGYGPSTQEASWLEQRIDELDRLVESLNILKGNYPVLSAIRMFPIRMAAHLLPDNLYQDFALPYWRVTGRIRQLLLGHDSPE